MPILAVPHADHHLRAVVGRLDLDAPVRVGVLGCVRHQVRDDLRKPRPIAQDEEPPASRVHANGVVPLFEEGARRLDARGDDVGQIDLFALQCDLAPGDPRHVEQVVDQAHQVLHLPIDDQPFAFDAQVAASGHQLDGGHDGRQRVPELVPEHGQELVFHGVRALGLGPRGHQVAHVHGPGRSARERAPAASAPASGARGP